MNKQEKLLQKALNGPYSLNFAEFVTLLKRLGWIYQRQRGSHQIWHSPSGELLTIQDLKGKAKGYQVKQFIAQYKREPAND
jgi:predicted RNA binding protein YcfA (HicA-like mRNA interferase family)